jgi:anti-anti-sigma regulatory factor
MGKINMAKFFYSIDKSGSADVLSLQGVLDEDFSLDLGELNRRIGKQCVFNFRGVESINSCGVRTWINFLRDFEVDRDIIFQECSPEIVDQIDMIPSFKGSASIDSAYANYLCNSCGFEKSVLFTKDQMNNAQDSLESVSCDKCSNQMEIESFAEDFISIFSE